MNGKMHRQKVIFIFCLREMMNRREATLLALSEASGVSTHTIQRAINGHPVMAFNGGCILTALTTKVFHRKRKL